MRVAALYDIHGNLPALEAVLEEVRRAAVDLILVGGDVFPGPLAHECLALLLDQEIPIRFIRGNGDRALLARAAGETVTGVPEQVHGALRWLAEGLTPEHRHQMGNWQASLELQIEGLGPVFFCHATPRNDTEIFLRTTPEAVLAPVFEGVEAGTVVCGHTHMQFDRTIGARRIVNAGSVGMPFGRPGGYWLTLGPELEHHRTAYDLRAAAERIRASGYPGAEAFADEQVLSPPDEETMLERFQNVQLR